nr:uncharacterized protein LOC123771449 [Procambarus clarkii]
MGFRAEVNYEGEEKTHTTPITPTKKSSVGIVEPAPRLAQDQESHQGPDYFPVHDSHPVRDPAHSSPRPHASGHYPSTQPVLASLADQKLHFHNYVTTASPNPFRLVVEKGRASTLAPPPFSTTPAATHSTNTHTYNIVKQLTTTPAPPVATTPKTLLATPVTNSHVMDNGFMRTVVARNRQPFSPSNYPGAPATATKATNSHAMTPHTVYQDHTPTSVYQYTAEDSPASHTTLYSPDAKAVAYIQALGRSHLVPVLLPYTPRPQEHSNSPFPHTDVPTHSRQHQDISTFPQHNILPLPTRTYYLNRQSRAPGTHDLQGFHDGDSVEILRGDDRRPRLSLKVPAPHEADIYPSRPPFYHH